MTTLAQTKAEVLRKRKEELGIRGVDGQRLGTCASIKSMSPMGIGGQLFFFQLRRNVLLFVVLSIVSFTFTNPFASYRYLSPPLSIQGVITVSIILLWFMIFMRGREFMRADQADAATDSPADYTVEVSRIPPKATLEQLQEFCEQWGAVRHVEMSYVCNDFVVLLEEWRKAKVLLDERHERGLGGDRVGVVKRRMIILEGKMHAIAAKGLVPTGMAFVTFETQAAAYSMYRVHLKGDACFGCCPRVPRFQGVKLKVGPASEPNDVAWQNMEIPLSTKARRTVPSLLASVVLVLLAAGVVVGIQQAQQAAEDALREAQGQSDDAVVLPDNVFVTMARGITDVLLAVGRPAASAVNPTIGKRGGAVGIAPTDPDALFDDAFVLNLAALLGNAPALIVTVVNVVIRLVLTKLTAYERRNTRTDVEASLQLKFAVVYFLNTSLLPLLTDLEDRDWWQPGGAMAFVAANSIQSIVLSFSLELARLDVLFNKLTLTWRAKTEGAMRQLMKPPEWTMGINLATVLRFVGHCLVFGSVIPELYVIGAIGSLIMYFGYKYMITSQTGPPPHIGPGANFGFHRLLRLVCIGHVAMRWLMDSLFEEDDRLRAVSAAVAVGLLTVFSSLPFWEPIVVRFFGPCVCVSKRKNDEADRRSAASTAPTYAQLPNPEPYRCPIHEPVPAVENDPKYASIHAADASIVDDEGLDKLIDGVDEHALKPDAVRGRDVEMVPSVDDAKKKEQDDADLVV